MPELRMGEEEAGTKMCAIYTLGQKWPKNSDKQGGHAYIRSATAPKIYPMHKNDTVLTNSSEEATSVVIRVRGRQAGFLFQEQLPIH